MLARKICRFHLLFIAITLALVACSENQPISITETAVPSSIISEALTTTPESVGEEATAVSTTPPTKTSTPPATATPIPPTPTITATSSPWQELAEMPVAVSEMPAVVLNGRIYIAGGFGNGLTHESIFTFYDPETDSWSTLADLPFSLNHHTMAVVDGQIYVFATESTSHTLRYDAELDSWVELAPIPQSRWAATAVVLDDAVYIIGGQSSNQSLLRYDPANDSWTELAELRRPREHLAAVVLDGQIYAIGGRWDRATNTVERYNPETNQWTAVNGMNQPRSGFGAVVLDGKIIVGGGELFDPFQTLDSIEVYDPESRQWELQELTLPTPLHGLPFVTIDDELYVVGGSDRTGDAVNRGKLYRLHLNE